MLSAVNKKGISVMVGYVLLIGFAIFMSVGVYTWVKSYVPKDAVKCDDGVSLFVKDYECGSGILNITLKNNGRFNIGGYFIHATDDQSKDLATIDLSTYWEGGAGTPEDNSILYGSLQNTFEPNQELSSSFDISSFGHIYIIELIPIRFQEVDNRLRLASCGDAKIEAQVNC